MSLQDEMSVRADAARKSKKDIKNAKARARRAAQKAAVVMNKELGIDPIANAVEKAAKDLIADVLKRKPPVKAPARGSRFERGTGVFKCATCARSTRSTGRGDNEHNGQCAECYDLAGETNSLSDNGELYDDVAARNALEILKSKGVDGDSLFPEVVEALAKLDIKAFAASVVRKPAPVATPAPFIHGSVKQAVLSLFRRFPRGEFSTAKVVELIQTEHPGMNENSIRVWVTDFRKDGTIKLARMDGRQAILKAGKLPK